MRGPQIRFEVFEVAALCVFVYLVLDMMQYCNLDDRSRLPAGVKYDDIQSRSQLTDASRLNKLRIVLNPYAI